MKNLYLIVLFIFSTLFSLTAQNTAILLDGTSEYLSIPYKNNQNVGTAFTIEAWIYANNWATESWRGSIVAADTQGPDRGYAFRCGDNGKLSIVIAIDNTWTEILSPSLMSTNQWHHVATTVDGTTFKLYIDGQEVAAGSFDGTPSPFDSDLLIGSSYFDGRFFDGAIDEVRVWNKARTQQEIADNTTVDLTGAEDGLVIYLPMNDGAGNIATNLVDPACSATGIGVDDSNWIEGYSLPEFDLTLRSISGIDLINAKKRPQKIIAAIQNVGREAISNFTVSVLVDGDEIFTEQINETIVAGDLLNYNLRTPLDLSENATPEITGVISHPDDANALNNDYIFGFLNSQDNIINLYSLEQHNFGAAGQNQDRNIMLPADLSEYSQLLLHLNLSCPSGGCDPWDQPAAIYAMHEGQRFEIARYITPYGIACGDWTVDVTDFKSIFLSETNLNSYIQVWGPNGWLLDADLEFVEGEDDTPHSILSSLWANDYVVYGDPGTSHDLDEKSISLAGNTESTHVRMHITGHGQGNTFNAAEFYEVTHVMNINNSMKVDDYLWKADCDANVCANQAGNWLFPRAGWCPGQEVQPRIFNATAELASDMTFDYELADYTNLLNTGYNSSGHTEPHYRIHASLIEESASRYFDYNNLLVEIEDAQILNTEEAYITFNVSNNGDTEMVIDQARIYLNNNELISFDISVSVLPGETYPVEYPITALDPIEGENVFFVEIFSDIDNNPGDDVDRIAADFSVANQNVSLQNLFSVHPNPSPRTINLSLEQDLLSGSMELYNTTGILMEARTIDELAESFLVDEQGTYIIKVTDAKGNIGIKKVIVIE